MTTKLCPLSNEIIGKNSMQTTSLQPGPKPLLTPELLKASLNTIPVMQSLEQVLDAKLHSIHGNQKLQAITKFFQATLQLNSSFFADKTAEEKMQLLFNAYVGNILQWLHQEEEFSHAVSSLSMISTDQTQVEPMVIDYLLNRIQNLHTSSLFFALSQVELANNFKPSVEKYEPLTIQTPTWPAI